MISKSIKSRFVLMPLLFVLPLFCGCDTKASAPPSEQAGTAAGMDNKVFPSAEIVRLRDLYGQVNVVPAASGPVRIVSDSTNSVRFGFDGKTLLVEDTSDPSVSVRRPVNGISINIGNNNVSAGGDVYINGKKVDVSDAVRKESYVTAYVPKGTRIMVERCSGRIGIGDTHGPVSMDMISGEAKIGKITSASLRVNGSGDIDVERVDGDVNAEVTGSGTIKIGSGYAPTFTAVVSGSGDIVFNGYADRLNQSVTGSGSITCRSR